MPQVDDFLRDLNRRWRRQEPGQLTLRLLGSTALILQTDYVRGTKDGDVLETPEITPAVRDALLALSGKGTDLHRRHRMYLEVVGPAFPLLPAERVWHPIAFDPPLAHLQIEALDVLDVVVAKLARFHKTDRDDISAMAARDLVDPARFETRFRSAVQGWWYDARAEELPRIVRNFHAVQRDDLFVSESEIELPPWIDEG